MPDTAIDKLLLRNADMSDEITARFEKELAKRYREAYATIEAQIGKLFAAIGDPPTLVEAKRYGRLDAMRKAIADEYKSLTKDAISSTRDNSAEIFAQGAYGTRWAYDQAVGVELHWPVLSVEAIRASVWNGDTGESFDERFRNWATKDVLKFQSQITQGLALGYGFPKVARNIRDSIGASYNQAIRIVRTEATRNYTQGHLATYDNLEDVGVKASKQWVSTLDKLTRDTHGSLDGQMADENGLFYSNGSSAEGPGLFYVAAEDINCRCRIVEIIEGMEPELRRVRGEGIVPYKSYDVWSKENGKTESGWPKEKKAISTNAKDEKEERGHIEGIRNIADRVEQIQFARKQVADDLRLDPDGAKEMYSAISGFGGSGYKDIRAFQKGTFAPSQPYQEETAWLNGLKSRAGLIEKYVSSAPVFPKDVDIYRAVGGEYAKAMAKLKVGENISMGATSSFSSDLGFVQKFEVEKGQRLVFEVIGQKSKTTAISHLVALDEKEVISSKDNIYEVAKNEKRIIKTKDGEYEQRIVSLRQIF